MTDHTAKPTEAGDVTTLERENRELRAYLKAFCAATITPEDNGRDVGVHEANPTMDWAFSFVEDGDPRPERCITGGQIRRAMELVGFDKLNIDPATRTIADDLAETATLRREVKKLRGDVRAYEKTMEAIEAADRERLAASPAPRAPAAPGLPDRETIARLAALHGLGSTAGDARQLPAGWNWEEWQERILTVIPSRAERACYAFADALRTLAAAPAAPPADGGTEGLRAAFEAGEWGLPCEFCQGNGEVVTDWDRYLHSLDDDKGDEGLADCPKCGGSGRVDAPATSTPAGAAGDQVGRRLTHTSRCPDCRGNTFDRVDEQKPDGSFGPGPRIRCVECKEVFETRPAFPAPAASAGGAEPFPYQKTWNAIAAATTAFSGGAVTISVEKFRAAFAAGALAPDARPDPAGREEIDPNPGIDASEGQPVTVDYVNYRGERGTRRILPGRIVYGATEYHPRHQWLLEAMDLDKSVMRVFALEDMRFLDDAILAARPVAEGVAGETAGKGRSSVFVIIRQTGDYSDRSEDVIAATFDKLAARKWTEETQRVCQRLAEETNRKIIEFDFDFEEEGKIRAEAKARCPDPDFDPWGGYAEDVRYFVQEVQLNLPTPAIAPTTPSDGVPAARPAPSSTEGGHGA